MPLMSFRGFAICEPLMDKTSTAWLIPALFMYIEPLIARSIQLASQHITLPWQIFGMSLLPEEMCSWNVLTTIWSFSLFWFGSCWLTQPVGDICWLPGSRVGWVESHDSTAPHSPNLGGWWMQVFSHWWRNKKPRDAKYLKTEKLIDTVVAQMGNLATRPT